MIIVMKRFRGAATTGDLRSCETAGGYTAAAMDCLYSGFQRPQVHKVGGPLILVCLGLGFCHVHCV